MSAAIDWPALRAANATRCARWHDGGVADWAPTDWANAMAGEAGEACNAIKKLRRVDDQIANMSADPARLLQLHRQAITTPSLEEFASLLAQ